MADEQAKPVDFLVPTDFLTASMDTYSTEEGALTPLTADSLVSRIQEYLDTTTAADKLMNSNHIYWLTEALSFAVKKTNTDLVHRIGRIMYKLALDDPNELLLALSHPIQTGRFKGQSGFFVWCEALYTATHDDQNTPAVITINFILSYLLDNTTLDASLLLVSGCKAGGETGKNALLVLSEALVQSASQPSNQSTTALIANLFVNCLSKNTAITERSLIEEILEGSFKSKTVVYMLARSLLDTAKDNDHVAGVVCSILTSVINTQNSLDVTKALFRVLDTGPYVGMCTFDILLISLRSAAYISENDAVIDSIVSILQQLLVVSPNETLLAFTMEINHSLAYKKNGVELLAKAFIIALKHGISTTALDNLLTYIVSLNREPLARALTSGVVGKNGYMQVSPLFLLIDEYLNSLDEQSRKRIKCVVRQFAASTYAVPMLLSLPQDKRELFLECYVETKHPNEDMMTWLRETEPNAFYSLDNIQEKLIAEGIVAVGAEATPVVRF